MKTCPQLPHRDRDTSQLFRSLVVAALAFLAMQLAFYILKH